MRLAKYARMSWTYPLADVLVYSDERPACFRRVCKLASYVQDRISSAQAQVRHALVMRWIQLDSAHASALPVVIEHQAAGATHRTKVPQQNHS